MDLNAPEITPDELATALEVGEQVQVVDVRAPIRVESGRIDLVPEERFVNIAGSQLVRYRALEGTGIDPELPAAVVCGRGNDSKVLALHLIRLGCAARSLQGGMSSWMKLCLPRELEAPPSLDHLIQFDRIGKGALGYLLVSDGQALIVDPPRDASAYLAAAERAGAEVVAVADTHVHADYISGAPALSANLGVPYYLHPADSAYAYDGTPGKLDFQALEDGASIRIGRAAVRAMHTPGHTEGHLTYLVDDAVALTGDFVFIGSVGRPDLAGKVAEWTGQLWDSLEKARSAWSPALRVHPAHYGSDAERHADRSVGAEFGGLLETNEALGFSDRADFCAWVEGQSASFPDAYRKIKAVNVGLLPVDDAQAEELEVGRNECALGGK